ncbi:hypothetical protein LXL04_033521 [Taraxacum kok-saghyz]
MVDLVWSSKDNSLNNGKTSIKRLDKNGYQGKNEFVNELKMVFSFQHPNIMTFIGYCDDGKEMIRVYEYAINRSLDMHLQDPNQRGRITWSQRLMICLGAARGLKYLHSGLGEDMRVIHRDVKSANILLNETLQAKLCDFGLSRFGPRNQPHTQLITRASGTRFYMDPIYNERGRLAKESDVYSFGVVLFEMSSGMLAYHARCCGDGKEHYLLDLVRSYYDDHEVDELEKLIDPVMRDDVNMRSFHTFNKIAHQCINFDSKKRPTMDRIIDEIEKALNIQDLGDPLSSVAIDHNSVSDEVLAVPHAGYQEYAVQPIIDIAESLYALCLEDSGVLYEDPYIQISIKAQYTNDEGHLLLILENKNARVPLDSIQAVILPPSHLKLELSSVPEVIPPNAQHQCEFEVVNLWPGGDVAVLDFSYKFQTYLVKILLRLPVVLNKFLTPIQLPNDEFFPQWRLLSGPPLKLQQVVRGVRPMSLLEMANLFDSLRMMVCPGVDRNVHNLVVCTSYYSESTGDMLCLVRIETDPADRTQLRMTVASGDPALTFRLKEFIKDHLVRIPKGTKQPLEQ